MKAVLERLFVWLQYPLPHHLLSRVTGYLARSRTPWLRSLLIHAFIRVFGVDMSQAREEDPDRYASFNDFFTRALKPEARPLAEDPRALLCPADGTVSQLGSVRGGDLLQAKGRHYSLFELLGGNAELAHEFGNGAFATVYLSPKDYHRVHMPLGGRLREWLHVPGRLFSVNDATARGVPGLFTRNERCICIFDTDVGPMAVVLVGAMIVAGIETVFAGQITPLPRTVQRHHFAATGSPAPVLERGEELGRFLLGSTAIVLMPEGSCRWREGLGPGSPVSMGQALGQLTGRG